MTQFVAHRQQFMMLNCKVITISFGTTYWANVWLQETQSPYPLLLDKEQESYTAFGLSSSRWRAWGLNNLAYYAKKLLAGEKLKGNRGDTHQLGGDFIVDQQGAIQFAYASKDPTDRPNVQEILALLEKLNRI